MQQARERLSPARRGDRPCLTRRLPTNPSRTEPAFIRRSPTRSSPSSNRAACPGCSRGAACRRPLGLPKNAATGRPYSGINILILWCAVAERGFSGQSWLTFRQALKLGAHVRKGETGTTVVYADRFIPYRERTRAAEAGDEPEAIPFLKRFTVFNADQCEDLPADLAPPAEPPAENLILPQAEALIRATGADHPHRRRPRLLRPAAPTTSRCRRLRLSSSRSIVTGRFATSWVTGAARPIASTATSPAVSAHPPMRAKNWSPK